MVTGPPPRSPAAASRSPTMSVPADTFVPPEYVLCTPFNVSVPPPSLVSPPEPVMFCAIVELKPCVSIVPLFDVIDTARLDAGLNELPSCSVPPFKVRLPDDAPSALSAATDSVPCVIVVPPEYVLPPAAEGATVSVPAPVFSTAPEPLIVPV